MSFFEKLEIWKEDYIFLKYVLLNFKDYKNLGFNFPIGIILILLAFALPIAVFIVNHRKNSIAICVKQLLRHDAIGEGGAKDLKSLRLSKFSSIKKMLLRGGQFSSMVKIEGLKKPSYEEYTKDLKEKKKSQKINFNEIKIYLSEEKKKEAELIASNGITPLWKPAVISFSIVLIIALLFVFMPEILTLINSNV